MKFRTVARALFVVIFALVTYLTLTPNPDDTKAGMAFTRWLAALFFGDSSLGDKVAHFLAYASLGASAAIAGVRIGGRAIYVVIALALYGALLEGLQGLGGVRDPELADALANSLGAATGFPLMTALSSFLTKRALS